MMSHGRDHNHAAQCDEQLAHGFLGIGHLIFWGGGGWYFFEKNSLFPYRSEKNKMCSTKLNIKSLFFIQ